MAELQDVLDKLDLVNDVKLEIKDVISTDSLHFEDYPNLIAEHLTSNPSEQTIADRVTANGATIKDGVAFLKALKGNSIKWNQGVRDCTLSGVLSSETDWGKNGQDQSALVETIEGGVYHLVVTNNDFGGRKTTYNCLKGGHKMLMLSCYNIVSGLAYLGYGSYRMSQETPTGGYIVGSWIGTPSSDYPVFIIASSSSPKSVDIYVKYFQVFDLTAMGWEDITSADQFAQRLGFASANDLPFFPYDEGSIKHFSASEIVSKGRNIWDGETLPGFYNAITGVYVPGSVTEKCTKNAISVIAGESYYIKHSVSNFAIFYDETNTRCGMANFSPTNGVVVAPSNAVWMMVDFGEGDISNTYIERGTTAHGFAPYMTPSSLPLPSVSLYSAGTARDELDLAQGKLTRRIGVVKLADLDFSLYGADATGHSFFALLNDITAGDDNTKRNFLTREYTTMSFVEAGILDSNKKDKVICGVDNAKRVIVRDTAFSSASAFKAHFTDDDVLYYEVVTPSTTDIDKSKAFYKVENGGREQVDTTTSSPLVATIAYEH